MSELREEPVPEIPTKFLKKRKTLPKGRVVSLGAVWEYEDEEDIYSNGAALEDHFPNKKKSAISKRSQSMKIPFMNTTQWEDEGDGIVNQDGRNQASQLTAPPHCGKRKKEKAGPVALKSMAKHTPPFKNPTVTKPLVDRAKKTSREDHPPTSIISHHGWRSTEDSVKSASVILAKTTMEKLAAFRFKLAPDPQIKPVSRLSPRYGQESESPRHEPAKEAAHASPDYNLAGESFFNEALRTTNTQNEFHGNDRIHDETVVTPRTVPGGSKENVQHRQLQVISALAGPSGKPMDGSAAHVGAVPQGNIDQSPAQTSGQDAYPSSAYDPTSSEDRIFKALTVSVDPGLAKLAQSALGDTESITCEPDLPPSQSKVVKDTEIEHPMFVEEPLHLPDSLLPSRTLVQECVVNHQALDCSTDLPEALETPNEQMRPGFLIGLNAPLNSQSNHDELPRRKVLFEAHQASETLSIDIQVERSDMDDPETLAKETSGDRWGSDEFDQGLDDDDLLAIVSNNVVSQTPANASPEPQKKLRVCGRFLLPPIPMAANFRMLDAPTPRIPALLNIANPNPSSAEVVPTIGDEYPVDDGDEEEMLKLSEFGAGFKESFVSPESVQPALYELDEGKVFCSPLQFSPSKSQASGTSPSKAVQDHRTDKVRASQSLGLRKDSLPVGEEEDWSFIRSDEGEDSQARTSYPFHDPQGPVVPSVKSHRASSTPITRIVMDCANVQTTNTQMTSDTAWSIIDDGHEYEPLKPFARPDFPTLVLDRSPVVGLSPQTYLRTCFRIGEMFKEGVRRASLAYDVRPHPRKIGGALLPLV